MHYIDYIPGSPAFISSHPSSSVNPQIASSDVNELSRIVCKFNDYLKRSYRHQTKLETLARIASNPTISHLSLP